MVFILQIKNELEKSGIEFNDNDFNNHHNYWKEFYDQSSKNFICYLFFGHIRYKTKCECKDTKESEDVFNSINITVPEEWRKQKMLKKYEILDHEFKITYNYDDCKTCGQRNSKFSTQKLIGRLPKIFVLRIEKAENSLFDVKEFEIINLKKYFLGNEEINSNLGFLINKLK